MIVTQEQSEVLRAIGRLEGRFDGLEKRMDGFEKRMDSFEKRMNEFGKDLRRLSREQRWTTAVLAGLIGALGFWG